MQNNKYKLYRREGVLIKAKVKIFCYLTSIVGWLLSFSLLKASQKERASVAILKTKRLARSNLLFKG